jgi:hypothetical protein
MRHSERDLLDRYATALPERPTGFAERGVAVPFTAPLLSGARIRRIRPGAPELVLPGLGGRGVFVLPWEACLGPCAPTLHDRDLYARIARQPRIAPGTVRAAARASAATGLAGRPARAAAVMAIRRLGEARQAARRALAARIGTRAELPLGEALALAIAESGMGGEAGPLLAERLAALLRLSQQAGAAARSLPLEEDQRAAVLVTAAAQLTLSSVPTCLIALEAQLDELQADPAGGDAPLAAALKVAERTDWLLDGWCRLAALWDAVQASAPGPALRDILVQLPVPPAEVDAWPGPESQWEPVLLARRRVAPRPSWTTGTRVDLLACQEQVRSLAA